MQLMPSDTLEQIGDQLYNDTEVDTVKSKLLNLDVSEGIEGMQMSEGEIIDFVALSSTCNHQQH